MSKVIKIKVEYEYQSTFELPVMDYSNAELIVDGMPRGRGVFWEIEGTTLTWNNIVFNLVPSTNLVLVVK